MAKKKVFECDWKSCRKRKGVKYVQFQARFPDGEPVRHDGHLCPDHQIVMIDRLAFEDIA